MMPTADPDKAILPVVVGNVLVALTPTAVPVKERDPEAALNG